MAAQRTGQEPVPGEIQRRKLGWLGHVLRRDAGNPTRIALGWNPQGTRKRGRPAHTWRRELDKEMKEMELSWVDLTRKAQDRDEWRAGGPWPILWSPGLRTGWRGIVVVAEH